MSQELDSEISPKQLDDLTSSFDDLSRIQPKRSNSQISQITATVDYRHIPSMELCEVIEMLAPIGSGTLPSIKETSEIIDSPEPLQVKSSVFPATSATQNRFGTSNTLPLSPRTPLADRYPKKYSSEVFSFRQKSSSDIDTKIITEKKKKEEIKELIKYCEAENPKVKQGSSEGLAVFQTFKLKDLRKYLETRPN